MIWRSVEVFAWLALAAVYLVLGMGLHGPSAFGAMTYWWLSGFLTACGLVVAFGRGR